METNGLMIGNWVYCKKYKEDPVSVFAVAFEYVLINNGKSFIMVTAEDIQPIEVTEEFLLNNGFEKKEYNVSGYSSTSLHYMMFENGIFDINRFSNSVGRDWHCHIENSDCDSIGSFDFQYVHEFQNGIRLITDRELEIKI